MKSSYQSLSRTQNVLTIRINLYIIYTGEQKKGLGRMDCLAVYDSGNYTIKMCRHFEKIGLVFEVISLPCKISSRGCSYCLKFPEEYIDIVVSESRTNKYPVRELYRVNKGMTKNTYTKIPF
jgi:hypothetical protein